MEHDQEIVKDLKGLVNIVNDGKEGYESAAEATNSIELEAVFSKYSSQRAGFAQELKDHIVKHGGESENEEGGVLGALHRTWIDIKQALSRRKRTAANSWLQSKQERRWRLKNMTRCWKTMLFTPITLCCDKEKAVV